MKKILVNIGKVIVGLVLALALIVTMITYHPNDIENIPIHCSSDAPIMDASKPIKVLSWNVQYFAGKKYVFFYDTPNGDGPDAMPEKVEIDKTFKKFLSIVKNENPDVLLLQELDVNAKRTYDLDQVKQIHDALSDLYACHTSTFYWKADFVPHPMIMGSVGLKLATFSKYKIKDSIRYQLPRKPDDIVSRQFELKRAVHLANIELNNGNEVALYNTHLDAFAQGNDTMQRQVDFVIQLLKKAKSKHWLIAGDFNLLPDQKAFDRLAKSQQYYYNEKSTELSKLVSKYESIPSKEDWSSDNYAIAYTHYPNDPVVKGPDRTIDYIFYSKGLVKQSGIVRQTDTLDISDHFPVIGTFSVSP